MSSASSEQFLQDRPRPGGFPTIQYARNVPKRGPSGLALMLGGALLFVIGMDKVNAGRRQRRYACVSVEYCIISTCSSTCNPNRYGLCAVIYCRHQ